MPKKQGPQNRDAQRRFNMGETCPLCKSARLRLVWTGEIQCCDCNWRVPFGK